MPSESWTGKGKTWGSKSKVLKDPEILRTGELYHYSPSQIKNFRACERLWAFEKIGGLKQTYSPYAALGTYIHKRLENYLRDGTLPGGPELAITITKKDETEREFSHDDIMAIMLPGLKHLPKPGVARLETGFEINLTGLGPLVGFVDLDYLADIPIVGDHKTTSNLAYALTPEELETDPQCVIYSAYAIEHYNVDEVKCQWIYYQTNKPKARLVEVTMGLTNIAKPWDDILRDVTKMKALRDSEVPANEVDYNVQACGRYNGCPYKDACGLTPADKMKGLIKMASMKDRIRAANAKKAEATTEKAPAPKPTPASLKTQKTAEGAGQAVNPPEGKGALARLKARQAQQAPAQEAETPPAEVQETKAPVHSAPPPPVDSSKVLVQKAPPPAAKAAQSREPRHPKEAEWLKQQEAGYTLYIDCAPNEACLDFSDVAGPVLTDIQAQYGCHYKLIPDLYGGNGAIFAQAMEDYLTKNLPLLDIMVTMSSPLVRDVIEVLAARACRVVRGF